jgi:hypothetical protein
MLPDYHTSFAATVPKASDDNPSATMASYAAALEDALATFRTLNAPADLPQLLSDLTRRAWTQALAIRPSPRWSPIWQEPETPRAPAIRGARHRPYSAIRLLLAFAATIIG